MGVPVQGSRSSRLANLANTVANSATFQKLVGAENAAAALAFVHVDLALDDGTQPFPRAIVRHHDGMTDDRLGTTTFLANGTLCVYVQYQTADPTSGADSGIEAFYSISGPLTEQDFRQHMNNLFGSISDDFRSLATTAGCLEWQKLEEHSGGEVDPTTENGIHLWEMIWCVHATGLP